MERGTLSKALNGGYIEDYTIDMRRNVVSMRVDVLENGALSSHEMRFEQVSHFTFETETRTGSGEDRLELTELWIDGTPESSDSEEWSLTISMWDMSHIKLRCSRIIVDGEALR